LIDQAKDSAPSELEEYGRLISILPIRPAFERRILEVIAIRRQALKLPAMNEPPIPHSGTMPES
jgi:hypothetical protein